MQQYPDVPGHNHVPTSIAAAESMVSVAQSIRWRIHALLLEGYELTSEETASKLDISHDNAWKRFSELRANGVVEDSGITRSNASGRQAIVWRIREEDGTDIRHHETKAELRATILLLRQQNRRNLRVINSLLILNYGSSES
jgi:predicted ArsR family transcriptional regulator